jgi:acyl-CoA synthetase (AMP-forming)/AMP-acid ligase II/3-oxoacyl-(acyl-carrier-protein) synthase
MPNEQNPSPAPVLPGETLVSLLVQRAQQQPDDTVYTFLSSAHGGDVQITYAQLDARAKQIAVYLKAKRVPVDAPVLLLFHPGIDYICAFFGCIYAGAIPVPAYPSRKFDRLRAIIDDADTSVVLTSSSELEYIRTVSRREKLLSIETWLVLDEAMSHNSEWTDPGLDASCIAFLQYTSGSTSSPKGVMVTHGNVLSNLRQIALITRARAPDVMVYWLPPYHDFGLIGGVLAPLVVGIPSVLMPPSSFLLSPRRWLKAISDYRGTITGAPNFAYDLCARVITAEQRAGLDLSCLRIAFNGAEPIRQSTLDRFSEAFAESGFRPEAWLSAYGLAESTLMVSGRWAETMPQAPASQAFVQTALKENRALPVVDNEEACDAIRLVNCGSVLPTLEVAIVDPHSLQLSGAGCIGEIWVSGPSVAKGYWKRPAESETMFSASIVDAPEARSHTRYMRTGDLGFVHEQCLYICGRHKDLMIINGMNIFPQDVELAAFESHPALRKDATIAFALESDDTERLVIIQELDVRQNADDTMAGGIAAAVSNRIGMPPDVIVLVKAGQLPRTSSGKVRRRQCRQDFIDGKLITVKRWIRPQAPEMLHAALPSGTEPDPIEAPRIFSAAEIKTWLRMQLAARLGVVPQSIETDQPFAYYGLDSMAAVQFAEQIGNWLAHPVPPIVFWDHPIIEQLTRYLASETQNTVASGMMFTDRPPPPERHEPIAIIGLSCRFPGAENAQAFWNLLYEGRDAIRTAPSARINAGTFRAALSDLPQTLWAGFLDDVDQFDPQFFGISPLEAARIDPQQRLVMEAAWHAFEDAGSAPANLAGSLTGVFIGISTHDYDEHQRNAGDGLNMYSATGSAASITANRLSYLFDFHGPSLAIDTACSSSLVAVHTACQSLRNRESNLALAGGVNLILSAESGQPFAQAGMLASDGRCKTFDASANGYVRAEGCGVIVLKRLSDALRDGDRVRAVIAGSAVMQDGRSNGLVAPNGNAQASVIRQALTQAGTTPSQLGYIETHGTGTVLGDPIELNALKSLFADSPLSGGTCAIGSVKTNIGHLEAAAGIASLIKVVLAIEHQTIPPHLHYLTPNPHSVLTGTGLFIPTALQAWECDGNGSRRYAGVVRLWRYTCASSGGAGACCWGPA